MSLCIRERGLLAEDEGKVVFRLLSMPQVFETESLQEAQQTLIIYGELSPWQTHNRKVRTKQNWHSYSGETFKKTQSTDHIILCDAHNKFSMNLESNIIE